MKSTLATSILVATAFLSACKSAQNSSTAKDVDSINYAGNAPDGQAMWTVKCADGWTNADGSTRALMPNGALRPDLIARYCTQKIAGNLPQGPGTPAQPGTPAPNIAAGLRAIKNGTAPCTLLNFQPKYQQGILRSASVICGAGDAVSGTYDCSGSLCKKGATTVEIFDDSLHLSGQNMDGWFSLNTIVAPKFDLSFYKDDGKCAVAPTAQISYEGPAYTSDEVTSACTNAIPAQTNEPVWGYKLNGECVDANPDVPVNAVRGYCISILNYSIKKYINTQPPKP